MYHKPPESAHISAVFIASDDRNFTDLNRIFQAMRWQLSRADTWQGALRLPSGREASHFLYQHSPTDRTWVDALGAASSLPSKPSFILTSRLGDERLWAEVLNRGGYDLLLQPFDPVEVTRVVAAAQKHSRRQELRLSALAG